MDDKSRHPPINNVRSIDLGWLKPIAFTLGILFFVVGFAITWPTEPSDWTAKTGVLIASLGLISCTAALAPGVLENVASRRQLRVGFGIGLSFLLIAGLVLSPWILPQHSVWLVASGMAVAPVFIVVLAIIHMKI